eukprot:1507495-Amphidinium_carterae.2
MALAMSTRPQQDLMPTTIAIFSDIEVAPSMICTPDRKPKRHESIQTSGSRTDDVCATSIYECGSFPSTSPEVAVRAGRLHAAPAPEGGNGGGDEPPKRGESRDPLYEEGRDPQKSALPNYSRFGTSGAGGTGGGPSDGGGIP